MATEHKTLPLAELAAKMAETSLVGGNAALAILTGEMQALGAVLPVTQPMTEAEALAHEAEVEDGFDNMPV